MLSLNLRMLLFDTFMLLMVIMNTASNLNASTGMDMSAGLTQGTPVAVVVKRFDVFLVNLDPTVSVEIQKTRPCLVISPNEMNDYIQTLILAPMATKGRDYPSRVSCRFENRDAHIVLDQICTVDKRRLIKRLGRIDAATQQLVLDVLDDMFAA